MGTTISAATLTMKTTISVKLGGVDHDLSHTLTIASVVEVDHRIVEAPTTEIVILAFAATNPAAGSFDEADVRLIVIINKDDTNFVQLTLRDENGTEWAVKLEAGRSFVYGASAEGVVDTMIASGSALTVPSTFADLVDITAVADTAAVDLELYVAGV
jgi:hypothetical protein